MVLRLRLRSTAFVTLSALILPVKALVAELYLSLYNAPSFFYGESLIYPDELSSNSSHLLGYGFDVNSHPGFPRATLAQMKCCWHNYEHVRPCAFCGPLIALFLDFDLRRCRTILGRELGYFNGYFAYSGLSGTSWTIRMGAQCGVPVPRDPLSLAWFVHGSIPYNIGLQICLF